MCAHAGGCAAGGSKKRRRRSLQSLGLLVQGAGVPVHQQQDPSQSFRGESQRRQLTQTANATARYSSTLSSAEGAAFGIWLGEPWLPGDDVSLPMQAVMCEKMRV